MIHDTPLTRRRLLAVGGGAAAAASIPGILMPARARAAEGWLARGSYESRIGQTFQMRLESGKRFGLKLVSVTGDDRSFDLIFQPTSSVLHDQATREISHPELGSTQFFVVPLKPPRETLKYVVSINRPR